MKQAVYTVQCPAGMLAPGRTVRASADGQACKTFTSVAAFDGYVAEVRRQARYLVKFTTPYNAVIEVAA